MNPQALFLALTFWAVHPPPGAPPTPPCMPGGPTIVYYARAESPVTPQGYIANYGYVTSTDPPCTVHIMEEVKTWSVAVQCSILIHELGHSVYRLPHSTDPADPMYPYPPPIPRWCRVRTEGTHAHHRHVEGRSHTEVSARRRARQS